LLNEIIESNTILDLVKDKERIEVK